MHAASRRATPSGYSKLTNRNVSVFPFVMIPLLVHAAPASHCGGKPALDKALLTNSPATTVGSVRGRGFTANSGSCPDCARNCRRAPASSKR